MSASAPHEFPPTHWSVIVAARDGTEAEVGEALNQLCTAYWPPLYAFARRWGVDQEAAPDLVQGFLARFIGRGDLVRSQPEKGRFRSFLQASFQNYLTSARRRERAAKRGGGAISIPIEASEREERWQSAGVAAGLGPEQAFDRRWAEEAMRRALARVEADYRRAGSDELFRAMQPALMGEGVEDLATLGSRFGLSAGGAGSAVHRMRRKFRASLRQEVGQTLSRPEEIDEEMRYLLGLLVR